MSFRSRLSLMDTGHRMVGSMMGAHTRLLMASLLIPCTIAAGADPVQISLRGTTIEQLPDQVVTITTDAEQAWTKFLANEGTRRGGDAQEGREFGVFSAVRRGISHRFCNSEVFSKSIDVEGAEIPASALVYVWFLKKSDLPRQTEIGRWHVGGTAVPKLWAKTHRLNLVFKKESDRGTRWLYRSPDGAFILFLYENYLVCPMHPEHRGGDGARCEICAMPKVPAWQMPSENEESP